MGASITRTTRGISGTVDPKSHRDLRCGPPPCGGLRTDLGPGPGPRSKCPYHQSSITNHRSRPVLRFQLVMVRASTDQKGFITGLRHHLHGYPVSRSYTNMNYIPSLNRPTNQPSEVVPPTRSFYWAVVVVVVVVIIIIIAFSTVPTRVPSSHNLLKP